MGAFRSANRTGLKLKAILAQAVCFALSVCLLTFEPAMTNEHLMSCLSCVISTHGTGFVLSFFEAAMNADIIRVEHAKHGTFLKLFKHKIRPESEDSPTQYSRDLMLQVRAVSVRTASGNKKEGGFETKRVEPGSVEVPSNDRIEFSNGKSSEEESVVASPPGELQRVVPQHYVISDGGSDLEDAAAVEEQPLGTTFTDADLERLTNQNQIMALCVKVFSQNNDEFKGCTKEGDVAKDCPVLVGQGGGRGIYQQVCGDVPSCAIKGKS